MVDWLAIEDCILARPAHSSTRNFRRARGAAKRRLRSSHESCWFLFCRPRHSSFWHFTAEPAVLRAAEPSQIPGTASDLSEGLANKSQGPKRSRNQIGRGHVSLVGRELVKMEYGRAHVRRVCDQNHGRNLHKTYRNVGFAGYKKMQPWQESTGCTVAIRKHCCDMREVRANGLMCVECAVCVFGYPANGK